MPTAVRGGREHALLWKLAQSERVSELYAAEIDAALAHVRARPAPSTYWKAVVSKSSWIISGAET